MQEELQDEQYRNDKSLDLLGGIEAAANFEDNDSDGGELFKDELAALEQEFNQNAGGGRSANPFGQSITKELLQQSKKELEDEMFGNDNDALEELNQDDSNQSLEELRHDRNSNANAAAIKKGLQIDIDDNLDFDQQNEVAQQLLDDKVMEHDKKLAQGLTPEGEEVAENDSITSDMPEEMISAMFDDLYQKDEVLQQMLGGTSDYDINEKLSILQAYKKGGGVAGLADIIDESEDDEGAQQQQMK